MRTVGKRRAVERLAEHRERLRRRNEPCAEIPPALPRRRAGDHDETARSTYGTAETCTLDRQHVADASAVGRDCIAVTVDHRVGPGRGCEAPAIPRVVSQD